MTSRSAARVFLSLALVALAFAPARAQEQPVTLHVLIGVVKMTTTTPFGQAKFTDNAGNVSYRVGAVFAAPDDATERVSVRFVCQTGSALSLTLVRTRVPYDQTREPLVGFSVDGKEVPVATRREVGNGVTAYTVTSGAEAEALAKAMRAGAALEAMLDDRVYVVSLEGFRAALDKLSAVCPHG